MPHGRAALGWRRPNHEGPVTLASIAAASGEDVTPIDSAVTQRSVIRALAQARAKFGGSTPMLVDGDGRTLTYDEILRGAFALGHALKKGTKPGEAIGIMLPTGVAAILAFFALSAYGRVPVMLNFTAGPAGVKSALRTAEIKRVITAHKFVALGKLEHLIAEMHGAIALLYLEDVRENLSLADKAFAAVGSFLPALIAAPVSPDLPAVILFTSGTEGEPKGVALSHANILANVEQVRTHIPLSREDVLFNPLPTFHSFGLTVGALMPLLLGVKTICHPSPRQPHEILRRVKNANVTILLSTDTFISQYARAGDEDDLKSLRVVGCGAERVREETRSLLRRKYAIDLIEGYGVTEASPVIAFNQPHDNRHGTVGRLLNGMESRLDPVEGIERGGRLFVRGPNVMLGYIKSDAPGVIVPPKDGWHDTGDVAEIDDEGYLAIKGRLKRFAKIGGEMVSLTVVENCASAVWPENCHAAVAIPDGRKGEQIILFTDTVDANRDDLASWTRSHGVPELSVPKRIVMLPILPVMGSGKTDYVQLQKMAAAET